MKMVLRNFKSLLDYCRVTVAGLGLAGFVASLACTSTSDDPKSGETHFLMSCQDTCGGGLTCLRHVCTRACSNTSECTRLAVGATCEPSSATPASPTACAIACRSDAECQRALGPSTCVGTNCVRSAKADDNSPNASLQNVALVVGGMAFNESANEGLFGSGASFLARNVTLTDSGAVSAQIDLISKVPQPALPVMADVLFWQVTMNWANQEGDILHEPASPMNAIVMARPALGGGTADLSGTFTRNNESTHSGVPATVSLDFTWVRVLGFGKVAAYYVWPATSDRQLAKEETVGAHSDAIEGGFYPYQSIDAAKIKTADYDYASFIAKWFANNARVGNRCESADADVCSAQVGCAPLTGTSWTQGQQCQARAWGCHFPAEGCGAAETRAADADGNCVHFSSTCLPMGFARQESCPFEPAGASPLTCP